MREQHQKRVLALEKALARVEKQMELATSKGIPRFLLLSIKYSYISEIYNKKPSLLTVFLKTYLIKVVRFLK